MPMRKVYELRCTPPPEFPAFGNGPLKVRLTAVAFPQESRARFTARSAKAAEATHAAMVGLYGALHVDWVKK